MEHAVESQTILYNVLTQAANLIFFFLIFKNFFAKNIINALHERKSLISKLQNAESEYKSIVDSAESAAKEIIQEANNTKKTILDESSFLAKQKTEQIMNELED